MARRCPFRSSGSCPVTSSSISSISRPSPHWSGARATVALTRSMGCPCCSSKGWLPARSGRASRRRKPRCGLHWSEPCWDALAREPSPPGAGVGAYRRRDRRRPELPVTLACADRGDRVRAVTPGDAAHAGSRRSAVLSVRPAARPPAAVVHRFRLRRHPGAGSGLRPEDALHPRPGDVSQLGDRLGAGLSDTLDRLRHLAVAGLADRPRRRVDRRRRFLAALPWRAIRVWHRAFGFGDVKLAVFIGMATGLSSLRMVHALLYGVFLGGFVAIILLITRIRHLKEAVPYGPLLVIGALISLYAQAP